MPISQTNSTWSHSSIWPSILDRGWNFFSPFDFPFIHNLIQGKKSFRVVESTYQFATISPQEKIYLAQDLHFSQKLKEHNLTFAPHNAFLSLHNEYLKNIYEYSFDQANQSESYVIHMRTPMDQKDNELTYSSAYREFIIPDQTQVYLVLYFPRDLSPQHFSHYLHRYRVGKGANLTIINVATHIPQSYIQETYDLEDDSILNHFMVTLRPHRLKVDTILNLQGKNIKAHTKGIYYLRAQDKYSHLLTQSHQHHGSYSYSLYKGLLENQARVNFEGLIQIHSNAYQSDAYLDNKNIIFNSGARVDSIPTLEIDNNDVRCSHGSTIGHFSQEEFFYLQSRGLDPVEVRCLLMESFIMEIVDLLGPVSEAIEKQFKKELLIANTQ